MVRIFWSAVAVLVVATAAVFFLPSGGAAPASETRTVSQSRPERPAESAPEAVSPRDEQPDAVPSVEDPATPEPADAGEAAAADGSTGGGQSFGFVGGQPGGGPVEGETPDAPIRAPAEARPAEIEVPTTMPRPEADAGNAGPGEPIGPPAVPVDDAEVEDAVEVAAADSTPEEPRPEPDAVVETVVDASDEPASTVDEPIDEEAASEGDQAPISDAGVTETETGEPQTDATETVEAVVDSEPEPAIATSPRPARLDAPASTPEASAAAEPVAQTPTGLLLDGRWAVDGKGTKSDPYVIEWDMLVAVQREYQPRLGKTAVPEWIAALDGKTVTIRGYALLPLGMSSMSELLVMLNQWDSCCIGIPPTPYDAIEVRLEKDLSPTAQSMFSHTGQLSFGDITGTFKVDPYIVQGYLLGLYLMEDATANLLGPAGTP